MYSFKVDGSNVKLVAMHPTYVYELGRCARLEREASGRHSCVAMSTATVAALDSPLGQSSSFDSRSPAQRGQTGYPVKEKNNEQRRSCLGSLC